MPTEAQYNAATALMQAVMAKHPETGASTEAMFALIQQCIAAVSGRRHAGSGANMTVQVACPACAHQFAVTAKMPLDT